MEMQSPFKALLQIQEVNYPKIQITSFNFEQQYHSYSVIKFHLKTFELLPWNILFLVDIISNTTLEWLIFKILFLFLDLFYL